MVNAESNDLLPRLDEITSLRFAISWVAVALEGVLTVYMADAVPVAASVTDAGPVTVRPPVVSAAPAPSTSDDATVTSPVNDATLVKLRVTISLLPSSVATVARSMVTLTLGPAPEPMPDPRPEPPPPPPPPPPPDPVSSSPGEPEPLSPIVR